MLFGFKVVRLDAKDALTRTHGMNSGGELIDVQKIFYDIQKTKGKYPELEGITFLGGEPFNQASGLALLGEEVKSLGLSVVTFSGYTYQKLKSENNNDWAKLLKVTDLLIDGPYVEELHDMSRPWVGSKNQNYQFLSDIYKEEEKAILETPNKIEVSFKKDGTILLNGMVSSADLEKLF